MPEDRLAIGGNNPPSMIATCDTVAEDISGWLAEHPVIQSEEDAKQAKLHLDRGKLSLKDLDDERDKAVRPLNEQVRSINEAYRPTKLILGKIIEQIGARVTAYIRAEEQKRIEAAREAARIAAEAERRAREAIAAEEAALESANTGELGVDTKTAVVAADSAIRDAEKAGRQAERAERETRVKVGGGFGRATALRNIEILVVSDPKAALECLGCTEEIKEAIIKAARAYRRIFGDLPDGVESQTERKL